MNTLSRLMLLGTICIAALSARSGWASSFSVEPVRVILDLQHRTERLAVKNESDRPLTLLIKSYRWTQPKAGTDTYLETDDLIIFPRALTLAAGEERFIRVGLSAPSDKVEQAFRIYLQEQPVKDEETPKGASTRVLMRLGIPVFAQPLKPEPALKVDELQVTRGVLHQTVHNDGNSFATTEEIIVNGTNAEGAELFVRNLGGFYLLAGGERTFDVEIPKETCRKLSNISVTTRNGGKNQQKMLSISSRACDGK
jgi:fimbrial chaperone protein